MITPEQIAKSGTEHGEQAALFCWAASFANTRDERLRLMFAIPNGDQRGDGTRKGAQIAGGRLKAEGMKPGVSDVFLPVPMKLYSEKFSPFKYREYHGLFIEMKRANGKASDVSSEQADFGVKMMAQGYDFVVCFGWQQARDAILKYLGLTP